MTRNGPWNVRQRLSISGSCLNARSRDPVRGISVVVMAACLLKRTSLLVVTRAMASRSTIIRVAWYTLTVWYILSTRSPRRADIMTGRTVHAQILRHSRTQIARTTLILLYGQLTGTCMLREVCSIVINRPVVYICSRSNVWAVATIIANIWTVSIIVIRLWIV